MKKISEKEEPDTFDQSKQVAQRGGKVAGVAREATEKEIGHPVSTPENFLPISEKTKELND